MSRIPFLYEDAVAASIAIVCLAIVLEFIDCIRKRTFCGECPDRNVDSKNGRCGQSQRSSQRSLISVAPSPPPTKAVDLRRAHMIVEENSCEAGYNEALRIFKTGTTLQQDRFIQRLSPNPIARTFGSLKQNILHLAAEIGNLELTKRLVADYPSALESGDMIKRTPLGTAVGHSRIEVATFLLDIGADIAAVDMIGNSILMVAAVGRCFTVLKMILDRIPPDRLKTMVNHQNNFGCSSLHFVAAEGTPEMMDLLIKAGANGCTKMHEGFTPLHWAAWFGRLDIVQCLVSMDEDLMDIPSMDGDLPFHTAALYDHCGIINFFLSRKTFVLDSMAVSKSLPRNHAGLTPLDFAAREGNVKTCQLLISKLEDRAKIRYWQDYPFPTKALFLACEAGHDHIVEILLSTKKMRQGKEVLKERDFKGRNCLVIALENNHHDVVELLVKDTEWQTAMYTVDSSGGTPMRHLITKFPDLALQVFNKCCVESKAPTTCDDIDYSIIFNYELIEDAFVDLEDVGGRGTRPTTAAPPKRLGWLKKSRDPLMMIVDLNRDELLQHPLVTTLLDLKWNVLRFMYVLNLYVGFAYAVTITLLIAYTKPIHDYGCLRDFYLTNYTDCTELCPYFAPNGSCRGEYEASYPTSVSPELLQWAVFALAWVHLLIEMAQLLTRRFKYFELKNLFDVVTPLLSILFVVNNEDCPGMHLVCPWQWQIGSVCLLSTWIKVTMKLRDFSFVGVFVSMFVHVLKTFCKIFIVLIPFFVSFAFTFNSMLRGKRSLESFDDPVGSLMKTVVMTVGELDYGHIFAAFKEQQTTDQVLTTFYFLVFLVVMPIIIMNLLLGLAVGDIGAIMEIAEIKKLRSRVNSLLDFQYNMPHFMQKWLYFKLWNIDNGECEMGGFGGRFEVKPNKTSCNKFNRRLGLAISTDAARKISAKLNAVDGHGEWVSENEKEIQMIATMDRINQTHDNIVLMQKKMNAMLIAVGADKVAPGECLKEYM